MTETLAQPVEHASAVRSQRRHITVLAIGGVLLVWLVGLVRFRAWIATGDHAIFQLSLERILIGDIPLSGAFSRFGVNHPGPAREWVVGVGYLASGGRSGALPATAMTVNYGFAAAAIIAAHRFGGRRSAAAAAIGAAVVAIGLSTDMHATWNPYLPMMAGYAAVWGTAAVIADRGRSWPLPVLAGAFVAQNHASGFMFGVIVTATALVAIAFGQRPDTDRRRLGLAVTAVVLAWSGPLVDLVNGGTWNLTQLARSGDGNRIGIGRGAEHVARKMLPWSTWAGETRTPSATPPPTEHAVVLAVVLVALLVTAWRVRSRKTRILAGVTSGVLVIATVSYALLRGFEYMYLFAPLAGALLAPTMVGLDLALRWVERLLHDIPATFFAAGAAAVVAIASLPGWLTLESIQSSPFERGLRGAIEPLVSEQQYAIVSAGMVGVTAEADVALAVHRAGGRPTSRLQNLGIPAPTGVSETFVVAMADPLHCLLDSPAIGDPIAYAISSDIGLPVGVFLIPPSDVSDALTSCGIEP